MSTSSPRLTLLPPAIPDHVHGGMQHGCNQDDEHDTVDCISVPIPLEPPVSFEDEEEKEGPEEEIVLVQARGPLATFEAEGSFAERAEHVAKEGPLAPRRAPAMSCRPRGSDAHPALIGGNRWGCRHRRPPPSGSPHRRGGGTRKRVRSPRGPSRRGGGGGQK